MATAIEREQTRVIRTRVIKARKAWRLHRQLCRTCAQLTKDQSQYCKDGWALRVELHHAETANRDVRRAEITAQQALF